jgi:dUTP pyrophosphatase
LQGWVTKSDEGLDLTVNLDNNIILKPMEWCLGPTRLLVEIEIGYEAQKRPGCGLAIMKGISILNSKRAIVADYRREVCIILLNLLNENFVIEDGERICRLIISGYEKAEWKA